MIAADEQNHDYERTAIQHWQFPLSCHRGQAAPHSLGAHWPMCWSCLPLRNMHVLRSPDRCSEVMSSNLWMDAVGTEKCYQHGIIINIAAGLSHDHRQLSKAANLPSGCLITIRVAISFLTPFNATCQLADRIAAKLQEQCCSCCNNKYYCMCICGSAFNLTNSSVAVSEIVTRAPRQRCGTRPQSLLWTEAGTWG